MVKRDGVGGNWNAREVEEEEARVDLRWGMEKGVK